jgi:hypothetical protein
MVELIERVELDEEPIGIIISRGSRFEAPSRFTAYVWGPVPEESDVPESNGGHRAA